MQKNIARFLAVVMSIVAACIMAVSAILVVGVRGTAKEVVFDSTMIPVAIVAVLPALPIILYAAGLYQSPKYKHVLFWFYIVYGVFCLSSVITAINVMNQSSVIKDFSFFIEIADSVVTGLGFILLAINGLCLFSKKGFGIASVGAVIVWNVFCAVYMLSGIFSNFNLFSFGNAIFYVGCAILFGTVLFIILNKPAFTKE